MYVNSANSLLRIMINDGKSRLSAVQALKIDICMTTGYFPVKSLSPP